VGVPEPYGLECQTGARAGSQDSPALSRRATKTGGRARVGDGTASRGTGDRPAPPAAAVRRNRRANAGQPDRQRGEAPRREGDQAGGSPGTAAPIGDSDPEGCPAGDGESGGAPARRRNGADAGSWRTAKAWTPSQRRPPADEQSQTGDPDERARGRQRAPRSGARRAARDRVDIGHMGAPEHRTAARGAARGAKKRASSAPEGTSPAKEAAARGEAEEQGNARRRKRQPQRRIPEPRHKNQAPAVRHRTGADRPVENGPGLEQGAAVPTTADRPTERPLRPLSLQRGLRGRVRPGPMHGGGAGGRAPPSGGKRQRLLHE